MTEEAAGAANPFFVGNTLRYGAVFSKNSLSPKAITRLALRELNWSVVKRTISLLFSSTFIC
jgi:hypothetical protein